MSVKAKSLKDAGNTAFKQGRFDEAVALYTEACQLDPSEFTYPLNRCMTYLKLGKHREAERDATKSLQLMPAGNPKAYFRRGLARKNLGKLDLARQDFRSVLEVEPSNEAAKSELDGLPQQPAQPALAQSGKTSDRTSGSKATEEAPNQPAATLNGHGVSRGDIPADKPMTSMTADRKSALKAAITPSTNGVESDDMLSALSTRRLQKQAGSPQQPGVGSQKQFPEHSGAPVEQNQQTNGFKHLRDSRDERLRASSPLQARSPAFPSASATIATLSAPSTVHPGNAKASNAPSKVATLPKNMYEFEKQWGDDRSAAARFGLIRSLVQSKISIPGFVGSSLSPELLDEVLACLSDPVCLNSDSAAHEDSIAFLQALTQCQRFDFISMLCGNTEMLRKIVPPESENKALLAQWGFA